MKLTTFFQTLPARLKVFFHALELLLMFYVVTVLMLLNTPLGVHLVAFLPVIAISFLVIYPPIHLIVELLKGVPGTAPDEVGKTITMTLDTTEFKQVINEALSPFKPEAPPAKPPVK